MRENNKTVYFLAYGAVIAALYMVLTFMVASFSFGPVQFRISEALCVLPFFTPAAVPGLFVGCLLSNLLYGAPLLDVIFGSFATLIGAFGTYSLRRNRRLVCLPPIISNMVIIPWVLRFAYGAEEMILLSMVTVGLGEILAVGLLGNGLIAALSSYRKLLFGKCAAN